MKFIKKSIYVNFEKLNIKNKFYREKGKVITNKNWVILELLKCKLVIIFFFFIL